MNSGHDSKIKVAVFIITTIIAAIIRFSATSEILEESAHNKIWVGVSFILGFAATYVNRKNFAFSALIVTAGFTAAALFRIFFDLIFVDPTSHNLFPIELIMHGLMSLIPAMAGAFLCSMILRLVKKGDAGNQSAKNKK